jgi:hypothetical protein
VNLLTDDEPAFICMPAGRVEGNRATLRVLAMLRFARTI